MTNEQIKYLHSLIVEPEEKTWVVAANLAMKASSIDAKVKNMGEAAMVMDTLLQNLLDANNYMQAALLLWGPEMFNVDVGFVRRVFEPISLHSRILLQGASSCSKTYGAGAWMYLNWRRDMEYTTIKLAAVNEDHLRKNLFAHVMSLHRAAAIPVRQEMTIRDNDLYMGLKSAGMDFGISGIAFKQTQDSSGQFKGYKPKPYRKKPHPVFGFMTRLCVLGDEAQNWPGGPFKDFNSLFGSMDGADVVKVVLAYNPEDVGQEVVRRAEPEQGWIIDDMETLYDWTSKEGWRVVRLDAKQSENVIARKVVFPGIQTYEGYLSYLKGGGDSSPAYFTFARGWPPMKNAVNCVIPSQWPMSQRGHVHWVSLPEMVGSADLAFQGADSAQLTVGKWGLAKGWTTANGKYEEFVDRLNPGKKLPRHVLEVCQLIPLEKANDDIQMSQEIIGHCKMVGIKPENLALDKSGNGFGTWSYLTKYWGDVFGINWAEGATEMKVLSEDREGADTQYDGVSSEMWFAFKRWLDPTVCAIIINTIVPANPLNQQLTSRRFRYVKAGKNKVESKEEYKARNQKSPDEADAIIMLPHLIRNRKRVLPGLIEQEDNSRHQEDREPAKLDNADAFDGLDGVGGGGADSIAI